MYEEPETIAPPAPPPIWMPSGGRGALYFWGGLALLLAIGMIYFFRSYDAEARANHLLRDQLQLFTEENEKLRSEIDKLQTQFSQTTTLLKSREQTLREAAESLQAVKNQTDQQEQLAEQSRRSRAVLETALTKALPADDGLHIISEDNHLLLRISDSLLFDGDETTLSTKGAELLKKIAAVLKTAPGNNEIVVDSYSDNSPPPTPAAKAAATPASTPALPPLPAPSPWDLSSRRACAALHTLAESGGFDSDRLSARPFGAEAGKVRRIDIVIRPTTR